MSISYSCDIGPIPCYKRVVSRICLDFIFQAKATNLNSAFKSDKHKATKQPTVRLSDQPSTHPSPSVCLSDVLLLLNGNKHCLVVCTASGIERGRLSAHFKAADHQFPRAVWYDYKRSKTSRNCSNCIQVDMQDDSSYPWKIVIKNRTNEYTRMNFSIIYQ